MTTIDLTIQAKIYTTQTMPIFSSSENMPIVELSFRSRTATVSGTTCGRPASVCAVERSGCSRDIDPLGNCQCCYRSGGDKNSTSESSMTLG
ncbi:Hypothetical protein NTJ_03124 [Nesidiocoris tenuis]|uniref:Uncharacterized protein n=1 Tax=Nesidiocoris tenuis TaxID=355587 RepID=A0ABN7AHG0_9HEMI|nr:Hypothetical protein NTJ_03124 [Nesidiocoris tenuis]